MLYKNDTNDRTISKKCFLNYLTINVVAIDCKDAKPEKCGLLAPAFCHHKVWGPTVKGVCRKSCRVCLSCDDLRPAPECNEGELFSLYNFSAVYHVN